MEKLRRKRWRTEAGIIRDMCYTGHRVCNQYVTGGMFL